MSDDASARLGLPYLAAGQMQKHVTLNEALTRLDALIQTTVVSRTVAMQPADPADGALYILPTDADGPAWSDFAEGALVRADDGGWTEVARPEGLIVLILDEARFLVWHGGWSPLGRRLGEVQDLDRLGLCATADAANPFLAKLNAALWTALEAASGGTGDLRLTLNKEAAADVLSLLFQSGYGGRAELGLIGDDDLRLKVSDGSDWREAIRVDRHDGRAWFAKGAVRRETVIVSSSGDYVVPAWARTIEAVAVGGGGGGGAGAFGVSGARFGGGGGGAGGVSLAVWPADQITGGLTVAIGAGGMGGVAAPGQGGGDTTIHRGSSLLLTGASGGGGARGDATSGLGGLPGAGWPEGNRGGQSVLAAAGETGRSLDRPDGGGGGGAGGALDASGTARAGGAGGPGGALTSRAVGGSGGSGASGGAGSNAAWPQMGWAGAGGGGGGAKASGVGFAGGAAGLSGAGGGGGGAGFAGGGAGGAGAAGVVWLTAVG